MVDSGGEYTGESGLVGAVLATPLLLEVGAVLARPLWVEEPVWTCIDISKTSPTTEATAISARMPAQAIKRHRLDITGLCNGSVEQLPSSLERTVVAPSKISSSNSASKESWAILSVDIVVLKWGLVL